MGRLIWRDHLSTTFTSVAKKLVFLSGTLIIFLFFLAASFEHTEALLRVAVVWILLLGIGYIFLNRTWRPTEIYGAGMLIPDMRPEYRPFRMLIAANMAPVFINFKDIGSISLDFDPFVIDSSYYLGVISGRKAYYNIVQNPIELVEALKTAGSAGIIRRIPKNMRKGGIV